MATLLGYLWPFLIYYVIVFTVSYIVVEYGQSYLYDEVPPGVASKVALGTLILASILTWTRSGFATMFTSDITWTVLLAIAWVGVFILIYRFQPWHGLGLGVATVLLFAGLSSLVVDSMLSPKPAGRIDTTIENKPIRRPSYAPPTPPKAEPSPAK
jgi:hypothetical protein